MKILVLAVGITHVTALGVTKSLVTLGAAYRWSDQYPAHFVVRKNNVHACTCILQRKKKGLLYIFLQKIRNVCCMYNYNYYKRLYTYIV